MDVSYCIICHKNNKILNTTIKQLNKNNNIYLHVDKKADINEFNEYKDVVNFIEDTVDVRWGSYSQIKATLKLLESTKHRNYDYIFLLSGDCLSLKNNIKIESILKKNNRREYVALDNCCENLENRIKYNYTKYHYNKNKNIFDNIIIKIHSMFRNIIFKNELYDSLPKLYKGTNWFGITNELRDYILEYVEKMNGMLEHLKNHYAVMKFSFIV